MHIPDLLVELSGTGLLVLIDVAALTERWGAAAWPLLEARLLQLARDTSGPGADLVVRLAVNLEHGEVLLLFSYAGLRGDFAQALYDALADLDPPPAVVARLPLDTGWYPLLAARDGEVFLLVDSADAPTRGGVRVRDGTLAWEEWPLPEEVLVDDGTVVRLRDGLRVAALVEVVASA